MASINVYRAVNSIISRSYILEQMVEKGEIAIIGAMHNLETGIVEFYEDSLISKSSITNEIQEVISKSA